MSAITFSKLRPRLQAFQDWLAARGAEVLVPTNEWEVARFKSGVSTGIVYRNGRGDITTQGAATAALKAFLNNLSWSAGVATTRTKKQVNVQALLQRDGDKCFLCGKPLGDDITRDHLVPVAHGGPNHISNLVLMHRACNVAVGHMPVMQKILMRERNLYAPTQEAA